MDRKYFTDLPAEKAIRYGLLVVITFLAGGWMNSDYRFSNYRTKAETEKLECQKEKEKAVVDLYRERIRMDAQRQAILDSAISDLKKILKHSDQ